MVARRLKLRFRDLPEKRAAIKADDQRYSKVDDVEVLVHDVCFVIG
jgi:hypothetical protein